MTLRSLIPLAASLATFFLAFLVRQSASRHLATRIFQVLAGLLTLWNLQFFVLYAVEDYDSALALARILRTAGVLMPATIFHLVTALSHRGPAPWRVVLVINYIVGATLALTNSHDLVISGLQAGPVGYASVGGPLYPLFVVSLVGNIIASFTLLVREYFTSTDPRQRLQLKFWLLGALVALPLGLTNLLPTYGVPFYPLGNLGSAVWAGIVAYAIVRHRLMDIDIVITKSVAYAAVSLALIAPAFALALWLQRLSFGQVHTDFSFALLLMLVGVGVLFPVLRTRVESRIERSLFREKREYRAALAAFSKSVVSILDRDRLLRELTRTLSETLQLDRLAVCLPEDDDGGYVTRYSAGIPPVTSNVAATDPIIEALLRHDGPVLRDELEAGMSPTDSVLVEVCRRNGWEVCIPLAANRRLIGFIGLGRKRNLDAFTAEDLQLLTTLAVETTIALENARLYEELKRSRAIIERSGKLSALGTLAAGIAHEIRNPLVSIQTFFQLAPQRLHDEEFLTSFLSLTAAEVQRISKLITELLAFARSPAHALKQVDLNDLIDGTLLLLDPEAHKHRLTLTRSFAPDLPLVHADADQIKQVLINLVLNAIQATREGGRVTVSTRSTDHAEGPLCQIEVRDSGVGMPKKMLEDIFNPFFTTKDKGTGLGLSIAHQIVSEHGGFITVTSEEGRGSSFSLNLPASTGEPAGVDEAEASLPIGYGRMGKF